MYSSGVWLCHRCFVSYDNKDIEALILRDIASSMISYTLQDIKCSQCNGIKKDNLSEMCYCGGSYISLLKKEAIKKKRNTLVKVAKSHQMGMLQHTLLQILE